MQSIRFRALRAVPLRAIALLAILVVAQGPCQAAELKPEAVRAFNDYISMRESEINRDETASLGLLWIDRLPEERRMREYAALRRGEVAIQNMEAREIPGGLVHDWSGVVFVPGASVGQVLAALQNYDDDEKYYKPDVLQSKTLAHSGNEFNVFLRIKRTHIVTVVFNTEYRIQYTLLDSAHARSCSYSTRIAEVENPGQATERELPPGDDHGFLWRLYSYWDFHEADGGTYIQCEAISLTRGIPEGLGWMVRPFIQSIPEESLRFTLGATRDALMKQRSGGISNPAK